MKISIITITCRENPRLEEMYRTLVGSLRQCPTDLDVEWIVVDEKAHAVDRLAALPVVDDFVVKLREPLPSVARAQLDKDPAHNSARNAGLLAVDDDSDYVVFLNDCTIVTKAWFELVRDCSTLGFRCRTHVMADIAIPSNGAVTFKDHNDRLREVPPATVAGPCWGAPKAAFDAIGGFDLSYDGEDRGHDADAILRLARAGVRFVCSERAFAITLRRTKNRGEVSTRKAAFVGARNTKLFNALGKERTRIYPLVTHPDLAARAGIPETAIAREADAGGARVVDHAAPVKSGRAGPRGPKDPTALDDYIALCHDVHLKDGWQPEDIELAKALWGEMRPNQKMIAKQKLGELIHDFIPLAFAPKVAVTKPTVITPVVANGQNGTHEPVAGAEDASAETWLGD